MRNRVRQSRTLGSVRGGDGAVMGTLLGHEAGNGGYSQGKPTAATGPLLLGVMLHRALAYWSRRSHAFGLLIKGRSDVIVRDGKLDETLARHNRLSEHDLLEDFRLNGNVRDMHNIALAVFERNGQINVVRREHQ